MPGAAATWTARVHDAFLTGPGAFGGWTCAVVTRAAQAAGSPDFVPKTLSLEFLARAPIGATLSIAARPLRRGRGSDCWAISVSAEDGTAVAEAMTVLARADAGAGYLDARMPAVPAPDTLAPVPADLFPRTWVAMYDMRHAHGYPLAGGDGISHAWTRLRDDPQLDFARLAALTDATPTRVFYRPPPRPSTTSVSLYSHYHCTTAQLAALGDSFLLVEATTATGALGYLDQDVRIWSPDGALLATSRQLVRASFRAASAQAVPAG